MLKYYKWFKFKDIEAKKFRDIEAKRVIKWEWIKTSK